MTASPLPTHDSSLGPSGGLKRRRSPSPSGATAKKPKLSPLSSLFSRFLGSFSSPVKGGAKSDSPSSPTPPPPPPSNPRRPLLAESSNLKSPADVEMPASSQFRLPQKHQARESLSQPRLSQPRLSQRTRDSLLSADFAKITPTKAIYPRFSQRNPDSLPVADFTEISPQKSTQTRLSQRGLKPRESKFPCNKHIHLTVIRSWSPKSRPRLRVSWIF